MKKGRIYLLTTAVIYGIIPVFAKQVALSNGDGVTLVFLRSALCLPLLFLWILASGRSFRLNKKQLTDTLVLTVFGNTPAMVLLYAAYSRGSVGAASMLHFVYPFIIVAVSAFLFGKKLGARKWLGVLSAAVGVVLSLDMKTDTIGAVLAVLSGVFYALFVLYLDRSGADKMDYWILT
ncbi:MAG: DMT family transporter, partial [Clostridia bacterium]|nr:DMT family transporter [Clostridia bacterium]